MSGVGLLGAIVLARDPEPAESPVATRRGQPAVAVTPVVTPEGGGASLSLTW